MQPVRVRPVLAASFAWLRARLTVTLALGAAVVLSLLSVCCGIGLLTTPWFMCELFALQLQEATGTPVRRTWSWVPAGMVMLGAVLLASVAASLALIGSASVEVATPIPRALGLSALMKSGGVYAVLSSTLALLFILPLLYAPLILMLHEERFDQALLESVRLVMARGVGAHVRLTLTAHALQVSPLAIAAVIAQWIDPSRLALSVLCAAPALCATVPLGQGMIVAAYAQNATAPRSIEGADAIALRGVAQTRRYANGWMLLVVMPLAALLTVGLSLAIPSRLTLGAAPAGELVVDQAARSVPTRVPLRDTALEVVIQMREVRIVASDGGGTGQLPLHSQAPIEHVRIVRVRDAFAVELRQAGRQFTTWVDRAGVRLDDDLRARLSDRVTIWELGIVLLSLLLSGMLTLPVLYALGHTRRGHLLPLERRPGADLLELDLERTLRRARIHAWFLLPLNLAAVIVGLRSLELL